MTTKTETNSLLTPGNQFHWLGAAMTCSTDPNGLTGGVVLSRGSQVTITQALLDINRGWLSMLGDEPAQIAKYGEVRFAPGPFPADLLTTVPGTRAHAEDRETARQAAWAEPDSASRRRALAAVEAKFGPAESTSTTIAAYRGGR